MRNSVPRIKRNDPLARGLKNALLFDGVQCYDAAVGRPRPLVATFGAPNIMPTQHGMALRTPAGAAATITLAEDWSGPCTVIARCYVASIDSGWGGVFSKNASAGVMQLGVGRYSTSDNLYLARSGSALVQLTSSSINADIGALHTFAFTNAAASGGVPVEFYRDGALIQSANHGSNTQPTGAGDLLLGCEAAGSASFDSDVYWLDFLRFDRVLTAAEIYAIGTNPRQLIEWGDEDLAGEAAGGAITIDGSVGNAVAAGVSGQPGVSIDIAGAVGNAVAAGVAGAPGVSIDIAGSVGNAVAAGITGAPGVSIDIAATAGDAVAAGVSGLATVGIVVDGTVGDAVAAGVTGTPGVSIEISATPGDAVAAGVTGAADVGGSISIDGVVGNAVAAGVAGLPGVDITISGSVGNAAAAGTQGMAGVAIAIDGSVGNAVADGVLAGLTLEIIVPGVVGNAVAAGVTGAASVSGVAVAGNPRYTITARARHTTLTAPRRRLEINR